jgi:hypothetical protein
MRRLAVLITMLVMAAGTALRAQGPFHVTQVNGFGGFGFDKDNTYTADGTGFDTRNHNLSTEMGLASNGFLYDPRLFDYAFSTYWDGNNNAVDQGSAKSNGLSYDFNASILPEGHYPLNFSFTQNHTNAYGSLITPYSTTNDNYSLSGQIKQPRFALISYSAGLGSTEYGLASGPSLTSKDRYANVFAMRDLFGWHTRITENYLDVNTAPSSHYAQDTLAFEGQRDFGRALNAVVGATYSHVGLNGVANGGASSTDILQLQTGVNWRHSEKLHSNFQASYAQNASNTLAAVEAANGGNLSLPFSPQSIKVATETVSGMVNYLLTHELSVFGAANYSNNGIPNSQLSGQTTAVLTTIASGETSAGGGYGYNRKIWELAFDSTGSVMGQFFRTEAGTSVHGLGYNLANSLRGGNRRKAEVKLSYIYNNQTNPIFFNIVGTTDQHGDLDFRTDHFSFVSLQGEAELGRTTLEMQGTKQNLHDNGFSLSASFPRKKLRLFAAKSDSDSMSGLFQTGSTLLQPGGSTGGVTLPLNLLNPFVATYVATSRAGLGWNFRYNLEIEGSYSQQQYLFTTSTSNVDHFDQANLMVKYKFGRFTLYGGYGRGLSNLPDTHQIVSQYYLRVRFPFHVFGAA